MNVVLLGGTRGIGRALGRLLASRGDAVFLLGRDEADLARSAEDLRLRGGGTVGWVRCDLRQPAGFGPALDAASAALGRIDAVVVTAGAFGTQDELEADPGRAAEVLDTNFARTVEFCEAARGLLLAQGGGTLAVFSSVAGDRGRTPVVLYGASKAGLSAYLEGLDHRFRRQGLVTVCLKPGFVRTGMTTGLREPPFAADAGTVARLALRAIDRGTPVAYLPGIWRWIMMVIRLLPRGVMRRVGF